MDELRKQVDEKKVKRLKKIIVMKESINIHQQTYNEAEMIRELYKLIKEEVQCYSNQ